MSEENRQINVCNLTRGYGKLLFAMKHLRRYLKFMNRSQLVDKIAEKAELTKKEADKFLSAYIETVTFHSNLPSKPFLLVKDAIYILEKQLKLKRVNTQHLKQVKL